MTQGASTTAEHGHTASVFDRYEHWYTQALAAGYPVDTDITPAVAKSALMRMFQRLAVLGADLTDPTPDMIRAALNPTESDDFAVLLGALNAYMLFLRMQGWRRSQKNVSDCFDMIHTVTEHHLDGAISFGELLDSAMSNALNMTRVPDAEAWEAAAARPFTTAISAVIERAQLGVTVDAAFAATALGLAPDSGFARHWLAEVYAAEILSESGTVGRDWQANGTGAALKVLETMLGNATREWMVELSENTTLGVNGSSLVSAVGMQLVAVTARADIGTLSIDAVNDIVVSDDLTAAEKTSMDRLVRMVLGDLISIGWFSLADDTLSTPTALQSLSAQACTLALRWVPPHTALPWWEAVPRPSALPAGSGIQLLVTVDGIAAPELWRGAVMSSDASLADLESLILTSLSWAPGDTNAFCTAAGAPRYAREAQLREFTEIGHERVSASEWVPVGALLTAQGDSLSYKHIPGAQSLWHVRVNVVDVLAARGHHDPTIHAAGDAPFGFVRNVEAWREISEALANPAHPRHENALKMRELQRTLAHLGTASPLSAG